MLPIESCEAVLPGVCNDGADQKSSPLNGANLNGIIPEKTLVTFAGDLESPSSQEGNEKASGTFSSSVLRLQIEVDRLAQKHRSELDKCLSAYLRRNYAMFSKAGDSQSEYDYSLSKTGESRVTCASGKAEDSPCVIAVSPRSLLLSRLNKTGVPLKTRTKSDTSNTLPDPGSVACNVEESVRPGKSTTASPSNLAKKESSDMQCSSSIPSQATTHGKNKKKIKKKISDFLTADARADAKANQTFLQRFTTHPRYEIVSVCLIVSNALLIGWETQFIAERRRDEALRGQVELSMSDWRITFMGVSFTTAFTIEVALRWAADGFFGFFETHDYCWNILDISVVGIGIIDHLLHLIFGYCCGDLTEVAGSVSVVRVLRVIRVVRVAKVIRVMKFFRELRIMVFSILGSLKPLVWVLLVLGAMFYVFGICFTVAASMAMTANNVNDEDYKTLFEHFGTLDRSVLSLYQGMSGGNDWGMYYDSLTKVNFLYRLVYLMYITISCLAIINIITGVFVDAAMQANLKDRDIVVHEELESKKAYLESMQEIFEEMDTDQTGHLTMEEFEHRLLDERVIAYFHHLRLDASDAHQIFGLLDHDDSGTVTIEEFLEGCYKLQGESRSMDMKLLQVEVTSIKRNVREFWTVFEVMDERLRAMYDFMVSSESKL